MGVGGVAPKAPARRSKTTSGKPPSFESVNKHDDQARALLNWTTRATSGLAGLLDCFARFALEGRGTPSPVEQTETLVVSGLYRFVRNPMYVCVLAIVSGQALLFGKAWLLLYAGVLLIAFHLFVTFYEEPNLRRRFGTPYETYCLHVSRWRPRLRSWRGTAS